MIGPTRVLVLTSTSLDQATTRYRVLQYIPGLRAAGFELEVQPFLSTEQERRLYSPGVSLRKIAALVMAGARRARAALLAGRFDLVMICREAMLYGPPVVEWWISRIAGRRLIFDFDDAVWVAYDSPTYGAVAKWIKCSWKTPYIIRMSAHVLAASPNLVEYARGLGAPVTALPTVVDTALYDQTPPWPRTDSRPVIGWVGSHSTAQYLEIVAPALQELAQRHAFVFRVVGAQRALSIPGVEVEMVPWRADQEIQRFKSLDVGVYPIRDDVWAQGKAAFKAIQYMAAGVPCIASPVGMTRMVVEHGVNGLLARSTADWVTGLDSLLTDRAFAERLIAAGRAQVREHYSLEANLPRLLATLRSLVPPPKKLPPR